MAKIPRVPVENQITTLSMVKITIKFSLCRLFETIAGLIRDTPESLTTLTGVNYFFLSVKIVQK